MSLLLDALKKAAEAKSRSGDGNAEDDLRIAESLPAVPPTPPPSVSHAAPAGLYDAGRYDNDRDDTLDNTHSETLGQRFSAYDEFDETQQLTGDFGEITSSDYGSQKHAETVFTSKSLEQPLRRGLPIGRIVLVLLLLVSGVGITYQYLQTRDGQLQRELSSIRARAPVLPELPPELTEAQTSEQPVDSAESTKEGSSDKAVAVVAEPEIAESATTTAVEKAESGPVFAPSSTVETVDSATEVASSADNETPLSTNKTEDAEEDISSNEATAEANPPTTEQAQVTATSVQQNTQENVGSNADKPALSISQSLDQNQADKLVGQAYAAYQAGDMANAKAYYDNALQADSNHRDALLGRAAIHLRESETRPAIEIYRRLLASNPRDHGALAGLNALASDDNLARYESDLRFLIRDNPQSAALNYALGAVLSRQKRWADAQQSFFNAFSAAPENPDIAFNLAVSLDNLGKHKPAADYYRTALTLANSRSASFDQSAVQRRLQSLEQ